MANPISVAVPHNLSRDEVRERMKAKVGRLGDFIPGGNAAITSNWPSEDQMTLDVSAMGQSVHAILDIEDKAVRVTAQLPGMLGMFAGAIEGAIKEKGEKILIADASKDKTGVS